MPFLCSHPGVCSSGVNQTDNREAKPIGHPHDTQCLAVALRVSTSEIAFDVLLGITTFLGPNNHDTVLAEHCKPRHNRMIIVKQTVSM